MWCSVKGYPKRKGQHLENERGFALFNCALEKVFRKLEREQKGLNINGENITNLRSADDVVLIASSKEELRGMIKDLYYSGE